MKSAPIFALTRSGIKEECKWDLNKEGRPCPRHTVHMTDGFNLVAAKLAEYSEDESDATTLDDYEGFNRNQVTSYLARNTFIDTDIIDGTSKLSGVVNAIRNDYSNFSSMPFEGLYEVYGFNDEGDEIVYIKGEELVKPEDAVSNAAADNDERDRFEDDPDYIWFNTASCMHCGSTGEILIPKSGLKAYRDGAFIQDAFPTLSMEKREQIKTGIHPECWNDMFPDEDEEGEDDEF